MKRWNSTILPAVLTALSACSAGPPPSAGTGPPHDPRPIGTSFHGMAIQLARGPDAAETYIPLLREIAALGGNAVLLAPAAQMEHARAQSIFIDQRMTPSREAWRQIGAEARRLGLRVLVMPVVLLKHPRGSEWRGVIDPPDWSKWWEDYRSFITYFADIANDIGADGFMVGSELVSTEKYTSEWVKTIELVRQHYPNGLLGYSANWDHYEPVKVWDRLDFIGMTSYYTLADARNPSVEKIVEKWTPIRDRILAWRARTGRPLLLTEVGWCSQEGAAQYPWNYYQNQSATPAGHEEQRRLYEAFMRVWQDAPGMAGVIWWELTPNAGGDTDYGYTPKDKPAEKLLRGWFERNAKQATPIPAASAAGTEP